MQLIGTASRKAAGLLTHHHDYHVARRRFEPNSLCSLNTGADDIGG
jgi:hypothetical protein